jgi:hypothetical protein
MPSISSQDEALSIPEILEAILLRLDIQALLTDVQLVCHRWTNVIRASPSIQQALFFMPRQKVEKTINPLLAEAFPSFFPMHSQPFNDGLFTVSTFDMIRTPDKKGAYARKEASWRRMLVQQPPISEFAFFTISRSREFFSYSQHNIMVSEKLCPQGSCD